MQLILKKSTKRRLHWLHTHTFTHKCPWGLSRIVLWKVCALVATSSWATFFNCIHWL